MGKRGFILRNKLKNLKGKLKTWATQKFGRYEHRIAKWENTLLALEVKEESDFLLHEERDKKYEAQLNLNSALKEEVMFWSQRSNALWMKHGDWCSKLDHRIVNHNRTSNAIRSLLVEDQVMYDGDSIRKNIREYNK